MTMQEKKTAKLDIRIEPTLKDAVTRVADKRGVTVSKLVSRFLVADAEIKQEFGIRQRKLAKS